LSPLDRLYCAAIHDYGLTYDMEVFNSTLALFLGSHDFRTFANKLQERIDIFNSYREESSSSTEPSLTHPDALAADSASFSSIRTVTAVSLHREPDHSLHPVPSLSTGRDPPPALAPPTPSFPSWPRQPARRSLPTYRVDIHLNGALYCMVRNIVGACLQVSCGKLTANEVRTFLEPGSAVSRHKSRIITAPAHGLTLENVFYENY